MIIEAALPLFASQGLRGATTRQIAQAAGVSEALLYQHFPSKDALYRAVQARCGALATEVGERLERMHAGTDFLVYVVRLMTAEMSKGYGTDISEQIKRLLLASLLGDGSFARDFVQGQLAPWTGTLEESLRIARERDEVVEGPLSGTTAFWFVHHLTTMLGVMALPSAPVVDYGVRREELLEQSTWFLLRGLGFRDAVIEAALKAPLPAEDTTPTLHGLGGRAGGEAPCD